MSKEEFDMIMENGYEEAVNDLGVDVKTVFSMLNEDLK